MYLSVLLSLTEYVKVNAVAIIAILWCGNFTLKFLDLNCDVYRKSAYPVKWIIICKMKIFFIHVIFGKVLGKGKKSLIHIKFPNF